MLARCIVTVALLVGSLGCGESGSGDPQDATADLDSGVPEDSSGADLSVPEDSTGADSSAPNSDIPDSDASASMVQITVHDPKTGVLDANEVVLFFDADGAFVTQAETGADGVASAMLPSGGAARTSARRVCRAASAVQGRRRPVASKSAGCSQVLMGLAARFEWSRAERATSRRRPGCAVPTQAT